MLSWSAQKLNWSSEMTREKVQEGFTEEIAVE